MIRHHGAQTFLTRLVKRLVLVGFLLGFLVLSMPGFMAYRGQVTARALMPMAADIQRALAAYAATHRDHRIPALAELRDYSTLRALVNAHGGTLPGTEQQARFTVQRYTTHDTDGDGMAESYTLVLLGWPPWYLLDQRLVPPVVITPHEITLGKP